MGWFILGMIIFLTSTGYSFASEQRGTPIFHVPQTKQKVVAFTFDDGPEPYNTTELLKVLKKERVKVTFFVLGKKVKRYPSLLRRIAKEGHEIGNHGYSHRQFRKLNPNQVNWELTATERLIVKVTGKKPRCFRPPFGQITTNIQHQVFRKGYQFVEWSIDPRDWEDGKTAKAIDHSVLSYVHTGDIVLFHDGGGDRRETIKAVRTLISELKAKGYTFVTVSELMKGL